jgi:hypothetical protein
VALSKAVTTKVRKGTDIDFSIVFGTLLEEACESDAGTTGEEGIRKTGAILICNYDGFYHRLWQI